VISVRDFYNFILLMFAYVVCAKLICSALNTGLVAVMVIIC